MCVLTSRVGLSALASVQSWSEVCAHAQDLPKGLPLPVNADEAMWYGGLMGIRGSVSSVAMYSGNLEPRHGLSGVGEQSLRPPLAWKWGLAHPGHRKRTGQYR